MNLKNKQKKKIPDGWRFIKSADILDVRDGTHDTPSKQEFGIPLITSKNIINKKLDFTDYYCISKNDAKQINKRSSVEQGDLLFSMIGSVGNVALITEKPNFCIKNVGLFKHNKKEIIPIFLLYFFSTEITQYKIKSLLNGGIQKFLGLGELRKFKISLPPLPEQKRIVGVLEVWDEGVEKLERKIEIKEDIKKGLMQQLLTGKKRLPGFSGEWEEKKLEDIGKCLRGVNYKPLEDLLEKDMSDSFRLLRSNNVKDSKININDIQIVVSGRVKHIQILKDDDIVICMANGSKRLVGKSAIFKNNDKFKYTFGAFMGVFRVTNKGNFSLIKYLFQTEKYRFYITNLLSGSSINNLKPSDIESLKFKIPNSKDEQKVIAEVLTTADEEIKTLRKKLEILKDQKKFLLNNLITGQIRT